MVSNLFFLSKEILIAYLGKMQNIRGRRTPSWMGVKRLHRLSFSPVEVQNDNPLCQLHSPACVLAIHILERHYHLRSLQLSRPTDNHGYHNLILF